MALSSNSSPVTGGYKVLLEGFEIKAISVSITVRLNECPYAEIAVTPHHILRRLRSLFIPGQGGMMVKCKPKVQVFYYDNILPEPGGYAGSSPEERLRNYLKLWKLIFDGDVTGVNVQKNQDSYGYSLTCQGHPHVLELLRTVVSTSDMKADSELIMKSAYGTDPQATFYNPTSLQLPQAMLGQGWSDFASLLYRFLGPIQGKFDSERGNIKIGSCMVPRNDMVCADIFAGTGGKTSVAPTDADADRQTNGYVLASLNDNGAVLNYYRPYMAKHCLVQRFFQYEGFASLLYWADSATQNKFMVPDALVGKLGANLGDYKTAFDFIKALLTMFKYNMAVISAPFYFDKEQGEGRSIRHILILPELCMSAVPACNVIFPCLNTQALLRNDIDATITRFRLKLSMGIDAKTLKEAVCQNFFSPPSVHEKQVRYLKSLKTAFDELRKGERLTVGPFYVTDEEMKSGVVQVDGDLETFYYLMLIEYAKKYDNLRDGSTEKDPTVVEALTKFLLTAANHNFLTRRFQANSGNTSGPFNPNIAIGFPAAIIDSEEGAYHQLGYVTGVSHVLSSDQMVTSVTLSHVRTIEDNDVYESMVVEEDQKAASAKAPKLSDVELKADKVRNLYASTLGTEAIDFSGVDVNDIKTSSEAIFSKYVHMKSGEEKPLSQYGYKDMKNGEYMIARFPEQGSPDRAKFEDYLAALKFGTRPQVDLWEFYTLFLAYGAVSTTDKTPEASVKSVRAGIKITIDDDNSASIATPSFDTGTVKVVFPQYFDSDIRDVVEVYYNDMRSLAIFRA